MSARRSAIGSMRRRSRVSESGYTLVELMLVVVLLGILTAIAGPRVNFSGYAVDSAMRAVGSTLLAAQRQAVQRGHNVVVAVDVENRRLRVHDDADNDLHVGAEETVSYTPLGDAVRFGRGAAPAGAVGANPVSFTFEQDGMPAVVFHRDGSASEEGGFYLTSAVGASDSTHAGDARAVLLERATGHASWYRYAPPEWERTP